MEIVIRTAAVYAFLLLLFRLIGKRKLSEANTFDMVVLLIISECTQEAMVGEDFSVTAAFLAITTLLAMTVLLDLAKQHSKAAEKILDGVPLVIVEDGKLLKDRMDKSHVDEEDLLEAAHENNLARLDQIRYAVLDKGEISIIPNEKA